MTRDIESLERRVDQLSVQHFEACRVLRDIPGVGRGWMGMTPDHVKALPEYKQAKAARDRTFAKLREFNAQLSAEEQRALQQLRQAQRAQREAEARERAHANR